MSLHHDIIAFIRRERLFGTGPAFPGSETSPGQSAGNHQPTPSDTAPCPDGVVVALSGGADSVALSHLLLELERACPPSGLAADAPGFRVAGFVHVHHGLRGGEADADEAFCRQLAERAGRPIVVERADVARLAASWRVSIEAAAHRVRYDAYDRARVQLAASLVATAHTRDDVAETLLLRLFRGARDGGLGAIRPRRDRVVRPLLETRRADLRAYLEAHGHSWRDDASNRDVSIPRNRIRHELLPLLERQYQRAVVDVLADTAADLAAAATVVGAAAERAWQDSVTEQNGRIEASIDALRGLPTAVTRRIVHRALSARSRGRFVGARHVGLVMALLERPPGSPASLDLPGQRVSTHRGLLAFDSNDDRQERPRANVSTVSLPVPGTTAGAGWTIEADRADGEPAVSRQLTAAADQAGTMVVVDAARVTGALSVRGWRAGDIMRPLGMTGRKKLQDLFVDRKIPREMRFSVPVVVDADGRIVWAVGVALSADFRVTPRTTSVLILKFRRSGGSV